MRAFYKFLPLFFFTTSLIMMSSCGSSDSDDEPISTDNIQAADFVGAWKLIDPNPQYLIINSDGSGSAIERDEITDEVSENEFDWVYMNPNLIFRSSEGRTSMFVSKITKNTMELIDDDKEVYSYIRVNKSDIPNHEEDDDNDKEDGNSSITTLSAEPHAFRATLSGKYFGTKATTQLGFEYSYDSSFPKNQTATIIADCKYGEFEMEACNIVDQANVFYRAFAVVSEKTIYGKTKSFTTPQGTYKIDGKEYKFIKVTGLPTGSFSMMQTELPPSAVLEVDGITVGALNSNNDEYVTKGETRNFFKDFGDACAYPRYPAAIEWLYAAAGGSAGKGYTYSGSDDIDEVAWYSDNSSGRVRAPGQKKANELGFYDMSGNYAELCADFDDYELEDIREKYTKRFSNVSDVSATYFNTSWAAAAGAFGGNWSSAASKCKANYSETYKAPEETNKIDCKRYSVRIVYSRPD